MLINRTTTKICGTGANVGSGSPDAVWANPTRITSDDASSATLTLVAGGQTADLLVGSNYDFDLPQFAVIDGISVTIDGSQTGCYGTVGLTIANTKDSDTLNKTYGSSTDLWGEDSIDKDQLNDSAFGVEVHLTDISGGDGVASVDYIAVTVYWHVDISVAPANVPTRVDYKVYSRDGLYLGLLPFVSSELAFSQDKNSSGASMEVTCGADIRNLVEVSHLLTEDDEDILTESDQPILATLNNIKVATGSSDTEAMFKNSNRVEAYLYNYYYPNGKLMFSGQVNRVSFQYGGSGQAVKLRVYSDGYDLDNYIARGYPFSYDTDVSQTSQNGSVNVSVDKFFAEYGQSWTTGASITNVAAITLMLQGTANVTVFVFDSPGGIELGRVTKAVSAGSATAIDFEFPQLIPVSSSTSYFMVVSVNYGQNINVYRHTSSSTYAGGSIYYQNSTTPWYAESGDLYFVTKEGEPTTTATYSTDDPVTEMMSGILLDYNNRGGKITERDFLETGLSITYTFNVATIYDAMKKVLELSPTGYYSYIDLGTAEMDIKTTSTTADYTVVRGKDIHQLEFSLSIEQVKNYLLFTGGDIGGGVNLFKGYQDTESAAFYGLRTKAQTDNRVTLNNTADAIGDTYIEENADEVHETKITILNENIDITKLTPGTTLGFRNFDNFIDVLVLEIVRRDYTPNAVTLTLGRLPVTLSSEVQAIYRGLLNEQTLDNPTAPT